MPVTVLVWGASKGKDTYFNLGCGYAALDESITYQLRPLA